ncbi:hypothetical protein J7E71_24225 [Mesobacillus foraminis]|uniref:hypothetical protein n=1 Tax=Mesobacillus foraminis TaxID=279826 RepID=UPI001BEC9415|nr:hypothetical protein [Mesobacillus foraminis]MBT2758982.1 hypothetical protein [Mesobacillus foraminis]
MLQPWNLERMPRSGFEREDRLVWPEDWSLFIGAIFQAIVVQLGNSRFAFIER